MKLDSMVEKYIALRDKKAAMKKAYELEAEKIDTLLSRVEGILLKHFEETGTESAKTAAGTAYKSERTSATVADWDMVLGFIQSNEAWSMLDKRVNKTAVDEYRKANGDLPPGVNWRSEVVVNVRRGS